MIGRGKRQCAGKISAILFSPSHLDTARAQKKELSKEETKGGIKRKRKKTQNGRKKEIMAYSHM